jgi:hypothetical protein
MKRPRQQAEQPKGNGIAETARVRIAQLEQERDAFVVKANQTIAAYNGAIGELNLLVNPPKAEKASEE